MRVVINITEQEHKQIAEAIESSHARACDVAAKILSGDYGIVYELVDAVKKADNK